jgi:hypothetical protein
MNPPDVRYGPEGFPVGSGHFMSSYQMSRQMMPEDKELGFAKTLS